MAVHSMDFGLRFEESVIKRFLLGGFITAVGVAFLLVLKSELQNDIQQSSFLFIAFVALISVSTFSFGLFVLCYRSCIDVDVNTQKIRFKKGLFLPSLVKNEYDFSDLESLVVSKEHDRDHEVDSEGNLRVVYSIYIQTLSGELIEMDVFFDAEKALLIASKVSDLTKIEIKRQNATLHAPWWLKGCYKAISRV